MGASLYCEPKRPTSCQRHEAIIVVHGRWQKALLRFRSWGVIAKVCMVCFFLPFYERAGEKNFDDAIGGCGSTVVVLADGVMMAG